MNIPAIDSIKHPAVKAARLLHQPKGRAAARQFLVEDADMIELALVSGAKATTVFLADAADEPALAPLAEHLLQQGIPTYRVSRGVLFKIVGTSYEIALNAVAVVEQRLLTEAQLPTDALIVVGERVQDPRNVGVLVRTADAAGAHALLLGADSGDPYSRSAVRSSTGSILRLPILTADDLPPILRRLQRQGVRLVSTSAHAATHYWDADLTGACAVLFGNESSGLTPALRRLSDVDVRIPLLGGAHSLNVAVAAGVVLYERVRQVRSSEFGVRS